MLWWPDAKYSSWSRPLGLIYNPADLEALHFALHEDAHRQYDRITCLVVGNCSRGPAQRLFPNSKLGNIPHNVVCYHYGHQYFRGNTWLKTSAIMYTY